MAAPIGQVPYALTPCAKTGLMKLSVIIPAYNESATIREVVAKASDVDLGEVEKEIIVVDDGSQDDTARILKTIPNIHVVVHARNSGKGAAISSGIRAATGDWVIIQDADLEYDPADYRTVIEPLLRGECDVAMGSRFLYERPVFWGKRRSPYFIHYIGNLTVIAVTNFLYGRSFTDYEGCYKAFARRTLGEVPVSATGFEFDNELICKLLRLGYRVVEVPITYRPRTYESGKKITWKHGIKILWTIVKWRLAPLKFCARRTDNALC